MNSSPLTYEEYLNTDHWSLLRIECFKKHGRRCALCHEEKRIQVHHWRYQSNWFATRIEDLLPLCDACHGMVHRHGVDALNKEQLLERYGDRFMNRPAGMIGPFPKGWKQKPATSAQQNHKRERKPRKPRAPRKKRYVALLRELAAAQQEIARLNALLKQHRDDKRIGP